MPWIGPPSQASNKAARLAVTISHRVPGRACSASVADGVAAPEGWE